MQDIETQVRTYQISEDALRNLAEIERCYVAKQRLFMFKLSLRVGLFILALWVSYLLWGLS